MSKPTPRLVAQPSQLTMLFREPAGLVCVALLLALGALVVRIAAGVW